METLVLSWRNYELGIECSNSKSITMPRLFTAIDIPPEKKDFIPHLTLARIGDTHNQLNTEKLARDFKHFDGMSFKVNEYLLYSSILTPEGAIHKIEEKYRCSTCANQQSNEQE